MITEDKADNFLKTAGGFTHGLSDSQTRVAFHALLGALSVITEQNPAIRARILSSIETAADYAKGFSK